MLSVLSNERSNFILGSIRPHGRQRVKPNRSGFGFGFALALAGACSVLCLLRQTTLSMSIWNDMVVVLNRHSSYRKVRVGVDVAY